MVDIFVKDLVKSFEVGKNLLDGLSFEVQQGERVGLLGKNGAGKTTVFRILTDEIGYDEGTVEIAPGKKVGLISQIPRYPAGYTVEEVLRCAFRELEDLRRRMEKLEKQMEESFSDGLLRDYDKLSIRYQTGGGYDMDVNVDKICNGLGIPKEMRSQEFAMLSGGEKTRVNLARLLLEETDILLLDEPTNHLDMKSVEWLEEYLLKFKGTVLTISHDRYFLDQVVDRIVELRGGQAENYSGNYSFYVEEKEARFQLQLKQYEQEQAKVAQLSYTMERMKGWGINNRTLYRRAMSIQSRIDRIQKTERPTREKTMHASFGQREFHGDEVMVLKDLKMGFGDRELFSDVNLLVQGGDRIALLGDNGTGKSTFLKLLMQEEVPQGGRIKFGPSVKMAYLPQIIHFDHPERSVLDTMIYEKNYSTQMARNRLGAFLFSGEDVFKPVSALSGGEQSRLRLCMLMDEEINLLILDEPTNHLDIASREWIENAVAGFEGTLLFVSHDRYFIDQFANRIWELEDGKISDFKGDYSQFKAMKQRQAQSAPQTAKAVREKKEKTVTPEAAQKKNQKQLEKQVAKLEREISKQEELLSSYEEKIQTAASDYAELSRLMTEQTEAQSALDEMYAQWEELSAALEG
ncbi:MAG: ABC-F family ATP-binding cassette domain-containing protein [Oscillospiraceae bacterium]|nr:ABC-F family ATP-binding cassette domain-containing protein [Oscillospiraceae bacterium]